MAQITAKFSDRESANLTLMRLRRSGVDFDLVSITPPRTAELTGGISYPACFGRRDMPAAAAITAPQSREDVFPAAETGTEMRLSVKSSQLQLAWDVLRSTGASDIRSRS